MVTYCLLPLRATVDLSYESQKYKLCNIVLFKFTASNAYLYKHGENHKSYGQTHSQVSFPRLLQTRGVTQTSCYITEAVPCFGNTETRVSKLNSTETNPVIFHIPENIFIGHATLFKHVNLILSEKSLRIEGIGLQLAFAIHNHCQVFIIFS